MTTPRPAPPRPAPLTPPGIVSGYLPEPLLRFADDGLHIDPKAGIARYGPRSLTSTCRHPIQLRVGLIGPAEQIENARVWLETCAQGVNGDAKNPEFPGRSDRMPDNSHACHNQSMTTDRKADIA